jgi:glutamate--cysteine ligase catalytic subunit
MQIEYTLIELDHAAKKPQLSLVGPKILEILQQPETDDPDNHHTKWRPEYASYMIEGMWVSTINFEIL